MSLEQLVRRVEKRLRDFSWRLVPATARKWWTNEVERLVDTLNQHHAHAEHFRASARNIRARLVENEVREAVLSSQVETYIHTGEQARAYELALELDQVRRQLVEDRARLPCEEKAYRMHRERIAELERRLAGVPRKTRPWASV